MVKDKICTVCKEKFKPFQSLQKVCSPRCANDYVILQNQKKAKRENRKRKQELKTNSELLKEAQQQFNKFIRLRDQGNGCISCGKSTKSKKNAGHYKTVGAYPELRFEELNCHLQCEWCNSYLSGNIELYRKNLIEKIGIEKVEWLEGPHEPKKYTREQIIEIKLTYSKKARELEKKSLASYA